LRARFVPTDLTHRTREIVAQFESAVHRAGLELRFDLDELPEPVWVDPEMWEKIVSNLLPNAIKFTFERRIEVSLSARPKHAELVVRDTGVGIPEDGCRFGAMIGHGVDQDASQSASVSAELAQQQTRERALHLSRLMRRTAETLEHSAALAEEHAQRKQRAGHGEAATRERRAAGRAEEAPRRPAEEVHLQRRR
jgi:Histidine kinase-, DNA gyrase B-, and HSP90-like ATPase